MANVRSGHRRDGSACAARSAGGGGARGSGSAVRRPRDGPVAAHAPRSTADHDRDRCLEGTTPAELARVAGMGVGLMSAGIGSVPAAQTYLDIGQGARIAVALRRAAAAAARRRRRAGRGHRGPAAVWERVARAGRRRARPISSRGSWGRRLRRGGRRGRRRSAGRARRRDPRRRQRARRRGGVAARARACPRVDRRRAPTSGACAALARRLRGDDLLIAIERAAARPGTRRSRSASPGAGFDGTLTSDSTRMRRLRALHRHRSDDPRAPRPRGPDEMSGEPIRRRRARSTRASCERLADRLAAIGPRRGPVIGASLLIWVGARRRSPGSPSGRAACARRCRSWRSPSPICRRCCC